MSVPTEDPAWLAERAPAAYETSNLDILYMVVVFYQTLIQNDRATMKAALLAVRNLDHRAAECALADRIEQDESGD